MIDSIYNNFYDSLGQRPGWFPVKTGDDRRLEYFGFVSGFIRPWAPVIKVAALAIPVILDIAYAVRHRKEISASLIDLYDKVRSAEIRLPTRAETGDFLRRNVFYIAAACAVVAVAVVTAVVVAQIGIFNIVLFLEGYQALLEAPQLVYAAYTCIGAAHAYLAKCAKDRGSMAEVVKHIFASCVSWATIATFITGRYETRWHHMSYGLLAMLPPLTGLNSFGAFMAVDSMLYWAKPMKDNYDFSDIFVKSASAFIIQMVALSCLEAALGHLSKPKEEIDLEIF